MDAQNPSPTGRPKALLLDGHSRAAPEVVLSLGRAGVDVHVAAHADDALALRARNAVRFIAQPARAERGAFAAWLRELDAREHYTLIVPSSDESLLGVAELAESDDIRRRAVIASDESLRIALDKQATWELAQRVGVDVPSNRILLQGDPVPPAGSLPTVLKPQSSMTRTSAGDRKLVVEIARSAEERVQKLTRMLRASNVQEQEYVGVGGTGIGVECLYAHGKLVWAFVHERLHEYPLTGGGSSYRMSVPADAMILKPAIALLDAIAWHGVAMVEFKRTREGRLVLMEINPRLWGSLALGIDCGVDFPAGLLAIARGQAASAQPAYRVGYRTRNVEADLLWTKANLRADKADPLLLTRPVARSLLEWLRPLAGKESWDYFAWNDLGPVRAMLARAARAEWKAISGRIKHARLDREARRRHAGVLQRARERGVARVVFLCYGNICRSPFAEAISARTLGANRTTSFGVHTTAARTSPPHLIDAAATLGVDLRSHRSRTLAADDIRNDDLLLVMDLENYDWVARNAPALLGSTTLLGLFDAGSGSAEIADPYSFDEERTGRVLRRIESATRAMIAAVDISRSPMAAESPTS